MEEITVPKGDFGYNLEFTVTDNDGSVYDLTDYTVTIKLWRPSTPGTLALSKACTVDDAENGSCYYTVLTGDTFKDSALTYEGELEATATSKEECVKTFRLVVTESG